MNPRYLVDAIVRQTTVLIAQLSIERSRDQGETVLSVLDDGRGVLPDLPRDEALTAIATNIGHSRKRQLSFDERMRQAMLGQYGIGLLGFWAVGHELQIRSRVNDSEVWVLTLFESRSQSATHGSSRTGKGMVASRLALSMGLQMINSACAPNVIHWNEGSSPPGIRL